MSDYIDRQAEIDETWKYLTYSDPLNVLTEVRNNIKALPAADVVEVIRCKDCKHYTPVTANCNIRGKGLPLIRGMNDFCSRAERRTDE